MSLFNKFIFIKSHIKNVVHHLRRSAKDLLVHRARAEEDALGLLADERDGFWFWTQLRSTCPDPLPRGSRASQSRHRSVPWFPVSLCFV